MSRMIKAIERHMMLPVPLGPRSTIPSVRSKTRRRELGLQSRVSNFVAEWQQREPRNAFRSRASKVAFGLRASVFCDDRRRGRLGGVMLGTIEAVSTHSGSLTKVGSEPAKSVKDDRP